MESNDIILQTRAQSGTSLYLLVSSADRRDEVCERDQLIISAVSHDMGLCTDQWLGYSSECLGGPQVLYRLYAANCRSCRYGSKYCLLKPRLNINLLSLYTSVSDMLAVTLFSGERSWRKCHAPNPEFQVSLPSGPQTVLAVRGRVWGITFLRSVVLKCHNF